MLSMTTIWMIAAIVAASLEMFTGTFYLLAIALGGFVAAAASWLGAGFSVQLLALAVATAAGAVGVRFLRPKKDASEALQHPDEGRIVTVEKTEASGGAVVRYRGTLWRAVAKDGRALTPGRWRIAKVDGAALVLEPVEPTDSSDLA